MKTVDKFWQGQARVIVDAAEDWEKRYDEVQMVYALELLLQFVLTLRDGVQARIADLWDDLFSGKIADVAQAGGVIDSSFKGTEKALAACERAIASVQALGYNVEHVLEFVEAAREIRRLAADFEKRWPRFDLDQLKEGLAEAQRGESVDVEGYLRDLQNQGSS